MTAGPDPLPSSEPRSPLAPSSVSTDLAAIFAEAAPGAAAAPSNKVRAVAGRRWRVPFATFGSLAAAGFVGLAGGALLPHGARGTPPAPNPAATATAAPAAVPIQVAEAPTVTLPPTDAGPIPVLDNTPVAAPTMHKALLKRAKSAHRYGGPRDLMAADHRLRVAYSHAVRAGVPRHVLVAYRDRWSDLREDASWRPDRVAAGYGRMTDDLERLARRSHGRAPPPRSPLHGLFGLFS